MLHGMCYLADYLQLRSAILIINAYRHIIIIIFKAYVHDDSMLDTVINSPMKWDQVSGVDKHTADKWIAKYQQNKNKNNSSNNSDNTNQQNNNNTA